MYDMTALTHATSLAHGFRIQTTTQSLVYPIPASVYRRRRILVAAVLSTVVFFASLVAGEIAGQVNGSPGSALAGAAGDPVVYVVQPGDSLWLIAERITPPGVDLRHTVDQLAVASGGPLLHAGQKIVLPPGVTLP
jgi:nucleoid-associated protein YgaU|tara:strand:+ start:23425 stop:23832 length:408 start_codon:yes stop_codon:yes gene_type:complete